MSPVRDSATESLLALNTMRRAVVNDFRGLIALFILINDFFNNTHSMPRGWLAIHQ